MIIPKFVKLYKDLSKEKRDIIDKEFKGYKNYLDRAITFFQKEANEPKYKDIQQQSAHLKSALEQINMHLSKVKETYDRIGNFENLLQSTLELSLGDFLIKFETNESVNSAGDNIPRTCSILTDDNLNTEFCEITLEDLACWMQIAQFLKGKLKPGNIEIFKKDSFEQHNNNKTGGM